MTPTPRATDTTVSFLCTGIALALLSGTAHASTYADCHVAPDSPKHVEVRLLGLNSTKLRAYDPLSLRQVKTIDLAKGKPILTSKSGIRDNHGLVCIELDGERLWVRASAVTVECKAKPGTISSRPGSGGLLGIGGEECAK